MEAPDEMEHVLAQIKAGDEQAASRLFHRFADRLVGLARRRLDLDVRRRIDPEDVVQSVFGSFFRRHDAGMLDVQSWESLWSLLAVMTVHKCGHKIRYCRAAKRSGERSHSEVQYRSESHGDWEAVAKDPTPSHVAMLNELLTELMRSLEPREREMLTLSLQGHSVEEISQKVSRSERTVRRVLDRIRGEMEDRCQRA